MMSLLDPVTGGEVTMHDLGWIEILKTGIPLTISLMTLWIVLNDRRPRLVLKDKEGNWFSTKKCPPGLSFKACSKCTTFPTALIQLGITSSGGEKRTTNSPNCVSIGT